MLFFFFKQKTAYEMRISDWSSDVCSSDLLLVVPLLLAHEFTMRQCVDVALGFLIFGIVASGTYLINDLNDLRADRAHPAKRLRPLASGAISVPAAVAASALLLLTGRSAEHPSELQAVMPISYADIRMQ